MTQAAPQPGPADDGHWASAAAESLAIGVWLLDRDLQSRFRNRRLDSLIPGVLTLSELAQVMPGVPLLTYAEQVRDGGPPVAEPAALLKAADPARLDERTFKGRAMTYYGRWTYKYEIAAEKGAAA